MRFCVHLSPSSSLVPPSARRGVARDGKYRRLKVVVLAEKEELDDATRDALRLPSRDKEKPETTKGNATRFGNVEGGKYGLGDRVDKALDATTDELQFKIGAIVCVTLPILLLIFRPRPPSEY